MSEECMCGRRGMKEIVVCGDGGWGCETVAIDDDDLLEGADGQGNWFCTACRTYEAYLERYLP